MLIDHYSLKLPSQRVADLTPAHIAAQPAAARPYLTSLRAHYDEVTKAMTAAQPGHVADVLTFASRAWRRPLTTNEKASLRAFYTKSRTANQLDHDDAVRAVIDADPGLTSIPVSRRKRANARGREGAERLGARQPYELLPVVIDS